MSKKVFLSEYEIESVTCLEEGLVEVSFFHPKQEYEIIIKDKEVQVGAENTLLTLYLKYEAETFEEAKALGEEYIREFLDYLTFASSFRFRAKHLLRIADWTPGLSDRECHVFDKFPGDDRPYPVLNRELLESLEKIQESEITPIVKRALRWYSRGVTSYYLDDQFQCFWFVVELISSVYKSTDKVNDRCAKCREPLYCEKCGDYPKHRPYTKQAIEHLFSLMVSDQAEKAFKELNGVRNALMHGDDMRLIEENKNIDFAEYVDKLGNIAYVCIFNTIMNSYKEKKQIKLYLLQASSFAHRTLSLSTHIGFKSGDPNNPQVEDIPNFEVSLVYEEQTKPNN